MRQLGGLAGNVALTFAERGGVFIGGDIVAELGEAFFLSRPVRIQGPAQPLAARCGDAADYRAQPALLGAVAALKQEFTP